MGNENDEVMDVILKELKNDITDEAERKELQAEEITEETDATETEETKETDSKEASEEKTEETENVEKTPQTKKYKIKYNGEDVELDVSDQDLVNHLQRSYDYETKINKLAEDRNLIAPYKRILETDWFKTKLEEGLRTGEIEKPAPVEKPSEEAIFEYNRKALDPDFDVIRKAMVDWALTLPEPMQWQLDNNYNVFNKEYDRVAKIIRKKKQEKPLNLNEKKKIDKIIAQKEDLKNKARVESSNTADAPETNSTKRVKDLQKILKHGPPSKKDEAAAELIFLKMYGNKNS